MIQSMEFPVDTYFINIVWHNGWKGNLKKKRKNILRKKNKILFNFNRSKSCPQCRCKCSDKNIHRLYFNIANIDTEDLDPGTLQNRIDTLKLQIREKETAIKSSDTTIEKLKHDKKKAE